METSILRRYEAHEASWRLKRKLARENPGVLFYTGITINPITILVHYKKDLINKPKKWSEYEVKYFNLE